MEDHSSALEASALPFGWEKATNPAGKPYYIDHRNRTTQWDPPQMLADAPRDRRIPTYLEAALIDEPSHHPELDDDALPHGWETRTNSLAQIYYISHIAESTQWERPTEAATAPQQNLPDLPKGWEELITPNGRKYYADHNTRTTSWVRPDLRQEGTVKRLPNGWERRISNTGRTYFVDHNARTTTWDFPKHLVDSKGNDKEGLEGDLKDSSAEPPGATPEISQERDDWVILPKL